jgi:hypothetical protein
MTSKDLQPSEASGLPEALSRALMPGPLARLHRELGERFLDAPVKLNQYGYDSYGFHPAAARRMLLPSALLYRYYFRVDTHGIENVPEGRVLLIGNHSGQFAYDGSMLAMAMLLEAQPPRLCRGMAEFFFWKTPWLGILANRLGMMAGTPENCTAMLNDGECVMSASDWDSCASHSRRERRSCRWASSAPRSSSRAWRTSTISVARSACPRCRSRSACPGSDCSVRPSRFP